MSYTSFLLISALSLLLISSTCFLTSSTLKFFGIRFNKGFFISALLCIMGGFTCMMLLEYEIASYIKRTRDHNVIRVDLVYTLPCLVLSILGFIAACVVPNNVIKNDKAVKNETGKE